MQIVTNKVENGYICTLNGKMYVFRQLTEVAAFFVKEFNDCIIPRILEEYSYPSKENESITSNIE